MARKWGASELFLKNFHVYKQISEGAIITL